MKNLQNNSSLNPAHWEHLLSEGFTDTQIAESIIKVQGVRSLSEREAQQLGFKCWSGKDWHTGSGLYLPFRNGFGQLRLDTPFIREKGKPTKYLTPVGKGSEPFIPSGCKVITEGLKDALAGTLHGGVPTGAIAGVSHYRKTLNPGIGHIILFDADGWDNPQVFAQLIHAGKWCNGRVVLLPKIEGQPHAGLCEYFKAGYTAEDYQKLLESAQRPEDLLQEWPEHWNVGTPSSKIVRLAEIAVKLATLYLSESEAEAFTRRLVDSHKTAGIRVRSLEKSVKPLKQRQDRKEKELTQTTFQKEYALLKVKFGERMRFNLLTNAIELDGVPFKAEDAKVVFSLDHGLPLRGGCDDLIKSVLKIAKPLAYHPVQDYLNQVWNTWRSQLDLGSFLENAAVTYLGNEDPMASIFLKKSLICAVARALRPGCKVDTATVLAGAQGLGKSQFWKTLASPDWFCDDFNDIDNKDHLLKLHEAWIIEWPELHGLSRKEATRVKAFMTTARERLRKPYAREADWMDRPSIIVGSSNDSEFLTDSTGNRRWWVIELKTKININKVAHERDQIWAAAVELYRRNEPWWLSDVQETAADGIRKQYQVVDAWHEAIAAYLEGKPQVSVSEILSEVLKIEVGRWDNAMNSRVGAVLKRCDWEPASSPRMHWFGAKKQRVWQPRSKPYDIKLSEPQKNAVPAVPVFHERQNQDTEANTDRNGSGTPAISDAVPAVLTEHRNGNGTLAGTAGVPVEMISPKEVQPLRNAGTAGTPISERAEIRDKKLEVLDEF